MWKYHVLMHENGKMRPVETVLGMTGRGIRDTSSMMYCKNFGKCHNVPPVHQ
jgi:hypothetical protein